MNYQVEDAINQTDDLRPIRSTLKDGYYHLTARNGDRRTIAAGRANTVLANADWPKRGKNSVLWVNAAA